MRDLIKSQPGWSFILVGPVWEADPRAGEFRELARHANVTMTGLVPYADLPAVLHAADVLLIPYARTAATEAVFPLKLFEYFALEKPVVVTSDMRECVAFPEVFHGDSAAALSEAIDRAARVKDDEAFRQRLRELADENDWIERARVMAAAFAPSLSLTK